MATASTESLENESGTATHEGGPSKLVAVNMMKPTNITPGGGLVKEVVDDQGDDAIKGVKRKRASSPSDGAALDGATDLAHGASLGDEHEGSRATSETRKEPKAKKERKKADTVKKGGKAPPKKATGANKKGKGGGTKGKAGAEGSMGSEAKKRDSDGQSPAAGPFTTPPPDDENADRSDTLGDEKAKPKGKTGEEKKVWSPVEDGVIITLKATKTPWKEIAAALNKLPTSSATLAVDATMAKNRWSNVLKHIITWSDEEIKTLKTMHDAIVKDPFTELANRMNKELGETKFTKQGCEKKIKEMKEVKSQ